MVDERRIRAVSDKLLMRTAEIWRSYVDEHSLKRTELKRAFRLFGDSEDPVAILNRKTRCVDFGNTLYRLLVSLKQDHGRPITEGSTKRFMFPLVLSTSSHPIGVLEQAAISAGVPGSWFPPNTFTSFENGFIQTELDDGLSTYHYPTEKGWLVCNLTGGDMHKIIAAIEAGRLPEFKITRKDRIKCPSITTS